MRRLLRNFISGWLAAQFFLLALVLSDTGGIGRLIAAAEWPLLPLSMLSLSLGGLIGAASLATAVGPSHLRRSGPLPAPSPARIR